MYVDVLKKWQHYFFIMIMCAAIFLSALIPHGQSPDEPAHLKRAYTFSHGQVFAQTISGTTGGYVDTGLLRFIEKSVRFRHNQQLTKSLQVEFKSLKFTGEKSFTDFPTHALYFPISYFPQALGFRIGELFGMSVWNTLTLIRLLCAFTVLGFVYSSFRIIGLNTIAMFLLTMPMTLFQMASPSTDAMHFSMVMVIASLYLKLSYDGFDRTKLIWLGILIFVLATHRINFYPLALLPLVLYMKNQSKEYLFSALILSISIVAWIALAMMTVKLGHRPNGMFPILLYYITHPFETVKIFYQTFTHSGLLQFYANSFIGQLGWLDYSMPKSFYRNTGIFLLLMLILCVDVRRVKNHFLEIGMGLIIFFFTYFILLVQWTPFPGATIIKGIQGRYLIPICIFVSYFIIRKPNNRIVSISCWLISLYFVYSMFTTVFRTLERYYIV